MTVERLLGIDLGTRKLAVAVFRNGVLTKHHVYEVAADIPRHTQLNKLGAYLRDVVDENAPDQVWIEAGVVGNNRKYSLQLAETRGAVLAYMTEALSGDYRVLDANNKAWKKLLIGNGNANKDMIREWLDTEFPSYSAMCAGDQDRYDATCVGLYGLRLTGIADDLHL